MEATSVPVCPACGGRLEMAPVIPVSRASGLCPGCGRAMHMGGRPAAPLFDLPPLSSPPRTALSGLYRLLLALALLIGLVLGFLAGTNRPARDPGPVHSIAR